MGEEFKIEEKVGSELDPGATPRRYLPDEGLDRLRSKIHKESKFADDYKNLPFKFSKPKKSGRRKIVECSNCGKKSQVGLNAVGIICSKCKQYASVKEAS